MPKRAALEVDTLTIRIPIRLQRRGGRKLIITPEGTVAPAPKPGRDETLVRALVRAHQWRRHIESGRAKSITGLAEQEDVTVAYVCRILPLTCLAPDVVEAILDGRQPKGLRLAETLGNGPLVWEEQLRAFGFARLENRSLTADLRSGVLMEGARLDTLFEERRKPPAVKVGSETRIASVTRMSGITTPPASALAGC